MNLETVTSFFFWCTIINAGLFLFWTITLLGARDLAYRSQKKFFDISKGQFEWVMYGFLGFFKLFVIVFNVVPWLALLIIK